MFFVLKQFSSVHHMNDKIRDDKGRFLPGVSGNPTGKAKDGSIPVQPAPVQDFRDILALAEFNEELEQLIAPVLGHQLNMIQPLVLKLAASKMKSDSRILAIFLQFTLNRIEKAEAKREKRAPRDLNQLEIEFEQHKSKPEIQTLFRTLGIDPDELNLLELSQNLELLKNPLSALDVPAGSDENRRETQASEK